MVDLRRDLPPIKDQGRRGTCVAFAATAAHEVLWADGIDLSEEFLFWAAKQRDGHPLADATTMTAAVAALSALGQPPETIWPYDEGRDYLATTYHPPADAVVTALDHKPGLGTAIAPTIVDLRAELLAGRVPLLVIALYDPWFNVQADGRIGMPSAVATRRGGHAVLVVGYDDIDGHFIVRNSWGVGWGNSGYGFLPYPYVTAHGRDAWVLAR